MNKLNRKCKVVILPTNEKPKYGDLLLRHIFKNTELECKSLWQYKATEIIGVEVYTTLNGSFHDTPGCFKTQHLYIISDNEIKDGDWYLNLVSNDIVQVDFTIDYEQNHCAKIIASTDSSLNLPKPSKQFIQKYISEYNKGNVIENIMVEYETVYDSKLIPLSDFVDEEQLVRKEILKTDSNNNIIIHPIKDNWTKEEIKAKWIEYCLYKNFNYDKYISPIINDFNKWIDKNL